MKTGLSTQIHPTGEAAGFIPVEGNQGRPVTVIGTNSIGARLSGSGGVEEGLLNA